ncbi:cation:proton antiporter [Tepidibacter aestuarii]|uniref:cation:proton antiporter n=1 Tax=Tepidibacter aestuarii TaxID=2925782 RepID=UPI0020BE21A6|nr:cation:proton antiporter [Tepidibacter aestuarii]CAH2211932.1 Sodium/proton antiporter, CPA1 family [Tepidibacter aestuarii]
MAGSLALIIILGLLMNELFEKIKLPGLLGMLILGMVIGPYSLNIIDNRVLDISSDLRKIALIVILLRAGLGISTGELKRVGVSAAKLSCIPGIMEGFTIAFISTKMLGFSFIQGGILGFIIAAVSPAVVVPQMLELMNNKLGTNKGIPTLIVAGASIDDVFAITIFTTFLGLYSGSHINITMKLLGIPVSILLGILLGLIIGIILIKILKIYDIHDTKKVLIVLGVAILLTTLEDVLKDTIEIASLLGVMTMGFIIREKSPKLSKIISNGFNHIWLFAQIFLFVLVGAQVNTSVAFESGFNGIIIICIGLLVRSIGVLISVNGTNLNYKERLFCVISYTPKATVQAAIAGMPLALGVESGDVILAIGVLAILFTAPIGALGIKLSSKRLLVQE